MKRYGLWLVLGIFLVQANAFALVRLGIKGGVNFANVSTDQDSVEYQRTPGFTAGVQLDVALAPALSVRTDLLYVQKNVEFTAGGGVNGRLNLDEAVLAPFLVLRYPLPRVIPFLQAGPEFSLNTKAKSDVQGVKESVRQQWRDDNFGLNLGAGVILPLGPSDLTVDARYNLGLVNLNLLQSDVKTRTNGIQVFVGYNFFKL